MSRFLTMKRLSVLFLGLFAVLVTGAMVFQRDWIDPGTRCERDGRWYDIQTRTCATPIYIPDITGRPEGVTRAEASNAQNRELIRLEREALAQRQAVNAEIERQRREFVTGPAPAQP